MFFHLLAVKRELENRSRCNYMKTVMSHTLWSFWGKGTKRFSDSHSEALVCGFPWEASRALDSVYSSDILRQKCRIWSAQHQEREGEEGTYIQDLSSWQDTNWFKRSTSESRGALTLHSTKERAKYQFCTTSSNQMLEAKWKIPEERLVLTQAGKWTKAFAKPEKKFTHMPKASRVGDTLS